jgi:hypothetical protein
MDKPGSRWGDGGVVGIATRDPLRHRGGWDDPCHDVHRGSGGPRAEAFEVPESRLVAHIGTDRSYRVPLGHGGRFSDQL